MFHVSLYDKASFGTIIVWIMQVSLFSSALINRFHYNTPQQAHQSSDVNCIAHTLRKSIPFSVTELPFSSKDDSNG